MTFTDEDYNGNYRRMEVYNATRTDELTELYREILQVLGEDPDRDGLLKTPHRVAKSLQYMTQGYELDAAEILKSAVFEVDHNEMVLVKDIELYSLCEHHMLPFFGRAHIAYIPKNKIVGLSKLARIVDVFARRLQVQERLTNQIIHAIEEALEPYGVAVVIESQHLCMMMRGVQKQNSITTTSSFTGEFEKPATRNEFINLVSANLMGR